MLIAFSLPPLLLDPRSPHGHEARRAIRKCTRLVGKSQYQPGGVVFKIEGAFTRHTSKAANAAALRALMDCLVSLDLLCLDAFPDLPPLYESGTWYHLMPYQYPWDTVPSLYERGYGDCKSLAALRIAELKRAGIDATPVFRHLANDRGTMFHILVWRGDGQWECPSRILGMRTAEEEVRS
ncbi:MAG: hypothetical protein FWD12_05225 [Alphaproteobacteria bacterium]|nr:hypothetical protein [Alphaproteobacteria bacterium]